MNQGSDDPDKGPVEDGSSKVRHTIVKHFVVYLSQRTCLQSPEKQVGGNTEQRFGLGGSNGNVTTILNILVKAYRNIESSIPSLLLSKRALYQALYAAVSSPVKAFCDSTTPLVKNFAETDCRSFVSS